MEVGSSETAGRPPSPESSFGRSRPINILTATPRGRSWWLQIFGFWIARQPGWVARRFGNRLTQAAQLKRLNFIHTARWVKVGRFPTFPSTSRLADRKENRYPYQWVMFCSNLNRGWEPYLQSFLDAFGGGIHGVWGESLDYPGYPRPRSRHRVNEWVRWRLQPTHHFYSAYPDASTNDVRCALRIRREFRSFVADRAALDISGETLAAEFDELTNRLQHCLVAVPPVSGAESEPEGLPTTNGLGDATGLSGFVSLMPLRPGTEADLIETIARLKGLTSPFENVLGTHFARFAVLDRRRAAFHPGREIAFKYSWLLFCADFEGDFGPQEYRRRTVDEDQVRAYFRRVLAQPELEAVFAELYDVHDPPSKADIEDDLVSSICPRLIYFRDYPDATLAEIDDAFYIHRAVMRGLGQLGGAETDTSTGELIGPLETLLDEETRSPDRLAAAVRAISGGDVRKGS